MRLRYFPHLIDRMWNFSALIKLFSSWYSFNKNTDGKYLCFTSTIFKSFLRDTLSWDSGKRYNPLLRGDDHISYEETPIFLRVINSSFLRVNLIDHWLGCNLDHKFNSLPNQIHHLSYCNDARSVPPSL
jgi:hypothetical protein